jgi:hypothetical protein
MDNFVFQSFSNTDKDAIEKFETCKFRSSNQLTKVSCCSGNITGFRCTKLNIYPLSFKDNCKDCSQYSRE